MVREEASIICGTQLTDTREVIGVETEGRRRVSGEVWGVSMGLEERGVC